MLGYGSFGTVYKGCLRKDKRHVAVKVMEKAQLKQKTGSFAMVGAECELMRECAGKDRFVQLYDVIETNHRFCLILEYCNGGNVQDGAMSQDGKLGEVQVRVLVHQMLEAVVYLHSKSICHRDVKPHNLFLNGHIASTSVQVKLGDFGAAVRLPKDKLLKDPVGTPAFMAPEIHLLPNKSFGYDHKCDVWSIGVCMIFLLVNEYPFFNGRGRLLRERLIKGGAPLWETNSFQNLFQGFQQAAGIASKRPSKLARDLTPLADSLLTRSAKLLCCFSA
jgi:serine/threonine protein kinase